MKIGDDSLTLTLDLLNPKSVGCDIVSRTTTVPGFKSFPTPTHPCTHKLIYTHTN